MTEVLVIGGSAGALEVLLELFGALPASFDTPAVVVVHLAADQKNLIPELMTRATGRRTVEAEDKQPLERGVVYIAPPNYHLLLERTSTLALSADEPVQFSRPSIDVLFESAAISHGPLVTGLVLSGANDDASAGLARIAGAGGRALVQDPATAAQPTMPQAARRRVPTALTMTLPELVRFLAVGKAPP